jgi:hypothetical protein
MGHVPYPGVHWNNRRADAFPFSSNRRIEMADGNGGGNAVLGVLVGALLVLVVGFFVFGGFPGYKAPGPGATLTVQTGK